MQIVSQQGNIVEKVIRDRDGQLIRAKFFVYQVAGRVRARLVDFSYIGELAGKILSLVTPTFSKLNQKIRHFDADFFARTTKNNLAFFGSKPRAPTLI
jgi:hypothetical protein